MTTYFLLANNKLNLKNNLSFDKNAQIIIFNKSIYLNQIKHNNISIISRIRTSFLKDPKIEDEMYAGLKEIAKYQNQFKTICFYNSARYMNENIKNLFIDKIQKFSIEKEKIIEIDKYVENLKKEIAYPKYKNMSTGLIYYNYLQKKEPGCKILLAGFTSEVNKNYHHASWERNYFKKELNSGRCEILW